MGNKLQPLDLLSFKRILMAVIFFHETCERFQRRTRHERIVTQFSAVIVATNCIRIF